MLAGRGLDPDAQVLEDTCQANSQAQYTGMSVVLSAPGV